MENNTPLKGSEERHDTASPSNDGFQSAPDMPFYPDDIQSLAQINDLEDLAYHNFNKAQVVEEIREHVTLFGDLLAWRDHAEKEH